MLAGTIEVGFLRTRWWHVENEESFDMNFVAGEKWPAEIPIGSCNIHWKAHAIRRSKSFHEERLKMRPHPVTIESIFCYMLYPFLDLFSVSLSLYTHVVLCTRCLQSLGNILMILFITPYILYCVPNFGHEPDGA